MPLILSGSAGLSGNVGTTTKEMLPAGTVLQVVQAQKTDTQAFSGGATPVDIAGLQATITPLSSSSKILCMWSLMYSTDITVNWGGVRFNLFRDSTKFGGAAAGSRVPATSSGFNFYGVGTNTTNYDAAQVSGQYLDAPASTSALIYKMQMVGVNGSMAIYINRSYADADNSSAARWLSTLTLMEIKA